MKFRIAGAVAACAAAAFAAPRASAQLAQSAQYQLLDWTLDGGGGGEASVGFSGHFALNAFASAAVDSPSFDAGAGFLQGSDPKPTNAPIIFGLSVDCIPSFGAVPLTVTGLNFDKFGSGGTVTVSIGGQPATGVFVASDTQLTCASPADAPGDKDVTVASTFGSDTLVAGLEYTPNLTEFGTGSAGCDGAHFLGANLCPKIASPGFGFTCSAAPPQALGLVIITNQPDLAGSDSLGVGILFHVNFFTSTELYSTDMVSDSQGVGFGPAPLPDVPALVGVTYYAQAYWAWANACVLGPYGLSSSPGLKVTLEQ